MKKMLVFLFVIFYIGGITASGGEEKGLNFVEKVVDSIFLFFEKLDFFRVTGMIVGENVGDDRGEEVEDSEQEIEDRGEGGDDSGEEAQESEILGATESGVVSSNDTVIEDSVGIVDRMEKEEESEEVMVEDEVENDSFLDENLNEEISLEEKNVSKISMTLEEVEELGLIETIMKLFTKKIRVTIGITLNLKATLVTEGEVKMSDKEIDFYFEEDFLGSSYTDENGVANFFVNTSNFSEGNKKIISIFKGDNKYSNSFSDVDLEFYYDEDVEKPILEVNFSEGINDSILSLENRSIESNVTNASLINDTNVSLANFTNISLENLTNASLMNDTNLSFENLTNIILENMTNITLENLTNVTLANFTNITLENESLLNFSEEFFYWNTTVVNDYFEDVRELDIKLRVPKRVKNITDEIDEEKKPKRFLLFFTRSFEDEDKVENLKKELEENLGGRYAKAEIENISLIKKIEFRDLEFEDNLSLGVEELNEERFIQSYAIDPSQMEFSNATITLIAKGERLYKCREWNFSEQECLGEWVLFKDDLVPGQEYSFELTKDDPGFGEEINITNAQHLDENRSFISNIFEEVELLDGNFSEAIYHGEYVRATFEKNMTNDNVINFYVRNNESFEFIIEIYEKDEAEVIGEIGVLEDGQYDIRLENMSGNNTIFDIKVVGEGGSYLEFDWIHDAENLSSFNGSFFEGFESGSLITNNWTVSGGDYSWAVTSASSPGAATGIYYIEVGDTVTESIIETALSTIGYANIIISFNHTSDGAITYLAGDWYNGTDWINFFNDSVDYDNVWQYKNYSLSSQAGNNPNFKVRFCALSDHPNEDLYLDDIRITGDSGPQINILYPQNGSVYNTESLFLRVDIDGNSLDSCWHNLNGTNVTFDCNSEPDINASEGANNMTVYVNNTVGLGDSDYVEFEVNTSIPLTISITSPSNGSISSDGSPMLKLLASDNQESIINYTLYIYNNTGSFYAVGNNGTLVNNVETEVTLSPVLNLTGNLTTYKIIVNVTDGVYNASSDFLYYTVTTPSINLVSPVNNYWDADGNMSFSFKVYDEAVSNISCSLFIDDVLNQTNATTLTGGTITSFDVAGIAQGVDKIWKINCTDVYNNTGVAYRAFNVDNTSPVVNSIEDSPDPVNAGGFLNITANVTDNFGVDYVRVNISGDIYSMVSSGGDIYYYEYNTSGLNGNYNYSVMGYDYAGNIGINETGSFSVNSWDVTFVSQSPADIDSVNIFTIPLNISYNITSFLGLNGSTVKIYYKTNSSSESNLIYTNGSLNSSGYLNKLATFNDSDIWYFNPNEYDIYPATYNYDDKLLEETTHLAYDLDSKREYVKIRLFNVSSNKDYSFFEVYVDNQSSLSSSLKVYYCNFSYNSGNPVLDNNCVNIYNLDASTIFNHVHNENSKHHLIPFAINSSSGMIGDVLVTNISYFLLRGVDGSNAWNVYYIENVSREDTIQVTTDNGGSWSNFSGTVDAHLHQYSGTETFRYYICANDTLDNENCTEERTDLLDFAGLPPNSPEVYSPSEGIYYRNITINYTSSSSPNGYDIEYYNVSLVDENENFVETIVSNNSLNLSYVWDSTSISDGKYYIRVEVCDNLSQCSYGYSENITINNSLVYLHWSNVSEYPTDPAYYVPETTSEFNISLEGLNLDSVWIDFDGVNYTDEIVNYSEVYHFNVSNLSVGVHNYTWWANNSYGEINYSFQNYTILALDDYRLNGTLINGTGYSFNASFKIYNSTGDLVYESDENFDYVFSGVEKYDLWVNATYDYGIEFFIIYGLFNNTNITNSILVDPVEGSSRCIVDPSILNYDYMIMSKKANFYPNTNIFTKCNDTYNLTTHTCEGVFEPWFKMQGEGWYNYTFWPGDPALDEVSGTFFEDWETGLLTTNNWSSSGGTNNWIVVTEDPYSGIYHAQAEATATESILTTNISTVGYENISFSFYYDTDALDGGEYLRADWYNGTDWINVLDVTATNTADYTLSSTNLTSDANDNSELAIRFRCFSSTNNEECKVDNIFVTGDSLSSCTYPGSGNWEIDCSDNCSISSNVDVLGNNISIIGFGSFTTTANITNFSELFIEGDSSSNLCQVYCQSGGCFK